MVKKKPAAKKTKVAKAVKAAKTSAPARRKKMKQFIKMQALGNDVILLDCLKQMPTNPPHTARKLCNRHLGIGADQLVLLTKSRKADFGVRFFNADGSEAHMCGNGIRAVFKYLRDRGLTDKDELQVETLGGIVTPRWAGPD